MLRFLKCGVTDVDLALLAPEPGLLLLVFWSLEEGACLKSQKYLLLISSIRPFWFLFGCVVEKAVVVQSRDGNERNCPDRV